jgi:chloramphenicol-sensitive protein RarD
MNARTPAAAADPVGLMIGVLAYLWWGMSALYWNALSHLAAVDVIAHRALWAVPFCALLLLLRGHLRRALAILRSPRNLLLLLLSSSLIAVNWWMFVWSVGVGRLTEASLGYFMQPLVVVLLGLLFFRERPRRVEWIALAFAAAGVLAFAIEVGTLPLLALGIAFSFAAYGALRKSLPVDSVDGLFIETLLLAPFALAWVLWHGGAGLGRSGVDDTLLVLSGVFTALPLIAYVASARRIALVTLGLLFYINPTCQFLLALWWFDEPVSSGRLLAFVLVWTGLAVYLAHMLRAWHKRSRIA